MSNEPNPIDWTKVAAERRTRLKKAEKLNLGALARNMRRKVPFRVGNKVRRIDSWEAFVRTMIRKAIKGDLKALDGVWQLIRATELEKQLAAPVQQSYLKLPRPVTEEEWFHLNSLNPARYPFKRRLPE